MIKLLFGLINLVAFLAILYYFFRKNYMPRLQQEMVDRVAAVDDLKKEYRRVVDRQAQLDNKEIFQEAHFKTLMLKVKRWRSFVEDKRTEREQELSVLKQRFTEKQAQIERALTFSLYRKRLEPQVLAALGDRLGTYYKDDRHAERFLSNSIDSFADLQTAEYGGGEQ